MPPSIVLHKRNGHRPPPDAAAASPGDMLRLVHSVHEHGGAPGFELLKFLHGVRSETAFGLIEQAEQEFDALRDGLTAALLRTQDAFASGELADVREALEAVRAQADLAAAMVARLAAAVERTVPSARGVVDLNEVIVRALDVLRGRPGMDVAVTSRLQPTLAAVAGSPRQLEHAVAALLARACRRAADAAAPVLVETMLAQGPVRDEPVVRLSIVAEGAADAAAGEDLELDLARRIVAEHGGVLTVHHGSEGSGLIVELPAVCAGPEGGSR
jgi:hypothetical protein